MFPHHKLKRAAAAVLCVLLATSAFAAPVPKLSNQQLIVPIAHPKTRLGQLVLMNADGTDPKPLTDGTETCGYPAWRPDGKKIAYCAVQNGVRRVVVADPDGTNAKTITTGNDDTAVPGWSPDGKRILFGRRRNSDWEVVMADADGSNETVVGNGGGGEALEPALSPDGKTIAFMSLRAGPAYRLCVMDADGKNVTQLVNEANGGGVGYPAWSPDGKTIAFAHEAGEGLELHTVGADGRGLTKLTDFGGWSIYPAWTPDGKRIAFLQYTEDKAELIVTDADGKNSKVILKGLAWVDGGRPAWRPQ